MDSVLDMLMMMHYTNLRFIIIIVIIKCADPCSICLCSFLPTTCSFFSFVW